MADDTLSISEGVPENQPGDDDSLGSVLESSFNALSTEETPVESEQSAADQSVEPQQETVSAPEDVQSKEEPSPPSSMEAPSHWSAADREMFNKQPPESQKWLMDRSRAMEAAHTRRSQEIAPMRQLVERWNPYFDKVGASAPQAIDLVLQTEYKLRTGSQEAKLQVISDLIRDYGVEAPAEPGEEADQVVQDPRVDQLNQQLQQMQAGWQQHQMTVTQQQQAARMQAEQQAQTAINAFATHKGDDGKLSHPFFGEVQHEMTKMAQADLKAGIQPDLDDLYDRACWATPSTRSHLLKAEQAQATEQRKQEADKARRAGGQISGTGAPTVEQPKDIRDTLSAAWDRLSAA